MICSCTGHQQHIAAQLRLLRLLLLLQFRDLQDTLAELKAAHAAQLAAAQRQVAQLSERLSQQAQCSSSNASQRHGTSLVQQQQQVHEQVSVVHATVDSRVACRPLLGCCAQHGAWPQTGAVGSLCS
jgi:hypothetical protein